MPRSKGLWAAWPARTGSTCAAMRIGRTPSLDRLRRPRLVLAVAMAAPALLATWGDATQAQTTGAGDRYSGDAYSAPLYGQGSQTRGPILSWPGKTAPVAPSSGDPLRSPAYADGTTAGRAPTYRAPTPASRVYAAAPIMPWYQRYASGPETPTPSPAPASSPTLAGAPTSIYDPPQGQGQGRAGPTPAPAASSTAAVAPPQATAAANAGETARFYSLHRPYGLTPDPDPIPPQFFTQTADLSTAPGPSPVYKAGSSAAGPTTAVHAVQSDDPTSTLGQP